MTLVWCTPYHGFIHNPGFFVPVYIVSLCIFHGCMQNHMQTIPLNDSRPEHLFGCQQQVCRPVYRYLHFFYEDHDQPGARELHNKKLGLLPHHWDPVAHVGSHIESTSGDPYLPSTSSAFLSLITSSVAWQQWLTQGIASPRT